MRVGSIIIGLFLIFPLSCLSQLEFNGGLQLGAITSQVEGDSYSGFNKIGLSGGAFLEIAGFSDRWSVEMNMLYSQKGSRNNVDPNNATGNYYRLAMDYIEVPVSVKYELNSFKVFAGLYYAYLLNSSQDTGAGETEIIPAYKNSDIGGHIGAQADLIEDQWIAELRLSNTFIPIRNAPNANAISTLAYDAGGYNTAIHLSIKYAF